MPVGFYVGRGVQGSRRVYGGRRVNGGGRVNFACVWCRGVLSVGMALHLSSDKPTSAESSPARLHQSQERFVVLFLLL